ncbi:MAG: gspD, partial [Chlamydiia bacterium]|nr:gspD [Chlamydiia bacterium]
MKKFLTKYCKSLFLFVALSSCFLTHEILSQEDSKELYTFSQLGGKSLEKDNGLIAADISSQKTSQSSKSSPDTVVDDAEGPIINFNNITIVEFLRFVSKLTGKNFIFDPTELQFSVTIISDSSATADDVMAILLQNLQIHDFELLQQGTSLLIHKNKDIKSPTRLFKDEKGQMLEPQLATQVFLIEYVDPARVATIVKNMLSQDAVCELIPENKRLIVTDVVKNIKKIAELLTSLDSPNSGLDIGQYVGRNGSPTALSTLTSQLMEPAITGKTFILIPHSPSNSVFVIASPFLVEKALAIMQKIDLGENVSGMFAFDTLQFDEKLAQKMQEEAELKEDLKNGNTFTDDEIDKLTDEQIRSILKNKGYTDEEISKMSKEQIRKILRETGLGTLGHALRGEIKKKKIFESNLPIGQLESTKFYIHKLQYRKSEDVVRALRAIATSLQSSNNKSAAQSDLVITLQTLQTLDESNSIVLT